MFYRRFYKRFFRWLYQCFYKRTFTLFILAITVMMFSVEAENKQVNTLFEGVVVNGVVDLKLIPQQVSSGSIRLVHQNDRDEESDDIPYELAQLATVSISQAILIAETAYPGLVTEAELDNEDDFLVWEIAIVTSEQSREPVELIIDAGDGRLLAVEISDND